MQYRQCNLKVFDYTYYIKHEYLNEEMDALQNYLVPLGKFPKFFRFIHSKSTSNFERTLKYMRQLNPYLKKKTF